MADEALMISAIEKLDSWLLKEADLRYRDCKKLLSLQFERKDLLIGMAEFWEDSKEKLYTLLVKVADPSLEEEGMVSKEKMHDFLVEMADLWEDDDGSKLKPLDIEKLHSLMLEMAEPQIYAEKLYSLAVEMADLWKESKGKLNKEKICIWLTNKAGLVRNYKVISLLEGMTDPWRWELKKKIKLPEEMLKNVVGAKDDLRSILDLLSRADEVEEGSRLHYLVSDVVEMAHDACLLVQLKDSDPIVLFLAIFNCFFIGRAEYRIHPFSRQHTYGKFFKKIVSIHRGLQETKELMLEFGFERGASQNVAEFRSKDDDHVVGLEEDVELLLRKTNIVTCIRGMGGIGKTTLARELYNHPAVVYRFERRAWVCLSSRELSRKELLIKLIRQLLVDHHTSKGFERDEYDDDDKLLEKMDNKSLRQMLHQYLQGRPYFIVLDDVSEDTCLKLKYIFEALPKDRRRRSRLLFTTRNADINCDDDDYNYDFNYKMKNLDDDKSWKLLLKTAFYESSDEEFFPKQLEKKGREMLRKCNGLPLAIKEMGSQWARKRRSGTKWEEVVESSIDLSETLMALESTYLNLNPHVKSCFLSLGFFKEGTTIRSDKLVQIWTAGGLKEEESKKCLSKLTQESIIESKEMTKYVYDDRVKTCRINAVFHKLSITKVEDDELGFEILRKDGNHKPRRRVIHCSRENFNHSTNQDKHLVSAFFHGGSSHFEYWNHFELLEILDMEGFGLKILPEKIGKLIGLRYMGLRNNHIEELPHSLGCLKELEVLDIAQNFMVQVPDVIWEMDRLRHLYMSEISCQKPLKIDSLKKLKTLAYISVDNWTYEVSGLKLMTCLRRLGIQEVDEKTDVSKLFKSLAKLQKLYCLILRGFRFRSMPSLDKLGLLQNLHELKLEGRLSRLPSASNFPPKIYYLSLVNSCLDEDPMPILEKLPELQNLKLQNAYTGHQMVISTDGFRQLCELVIRELWHLRNIVQVGEEAGLWFRADAEINRCPYLETVPQNIFLRLDHLKSQTVKCIVAEGEVHYTIVRL